LGPGRRTAARGGGYSHCRWRRKRIHPQRRYPRADLLAGRWNTRATTTILYTGMAKQLQAIIVGCGTMSSEWIRSAKELGFQITSLVDLNPESARRQAAAFQLEALIFDNLSEAIEKS